MLIICNGAFKCGSSWLHALIVEMLRIKNIPLERIPDHYTNDINSPTKIIESKLDHFVFNEPYETKNYITKSHFFKNSTLSAPFPKDVTFLFVEREVKDAIVSHYFHIRHKYRIKFSFSTYYHFLGRYKAYEIFLFNKRCKKHFGTNNFISFHALKTNFAESINKLSSALNIDSFDLNELEAIKRETTIDKLREKSRTGKSEYYPSKRKDNWKQFRKGKEGDWVHYFSDFLLKDITGIENGKVSYSLRTIYYFLFTVRRFFGRIE